MSEGSQVREIEEFELALFGNVGGGGRPAARRGAREPSSHASHPIMASQTGPLRKDAWKTLPRADARPGGACLALFHRRPTPPAVPTAPPEAAY